MLFSPPTGSKGQPTRVVPPSTSTLSTTTTTANNKNTNNNNNNSATDATSSFTGSYFFDTVLLLLVLFLGIEILDFAFYLHTNSPYNAHGSSSNLVAGDVSVMGAAEEEFELITAHNGNNSGGNISSADNVDRGSSGVQSTEPGAISPTKVTYTE